MRPRLQVVPDPPKPRMLTLTVEPEVAEMIGQAVDLREHLEGLAQVRAYAERHGIELNAAIIALVHQGLS